MLVLVLVLVVLIAYRLLLNWRCLGLTGWLSGWLVGWGQIGTQIECVSESGVCGCEALLLCCINYPYLPGGCVACPVMANEVRLVTGLMGDR